MVRLSLAALGLSSFFFGLGVVVPDSHRYSKQGTPQQAPAPLPSVTLPPELDRVLRDYERHWKASDGAALSALFTEDGFINRGGWIRGRDAIRAAYA
ncbi:MAG: YybH family protein, partial [Vicinamibacterales bacterium]